MSSFIKFVISCLYHIPNYQLEIIEKLNLFKVFIYKFLFFILFNSIFGLQKNIILHPLIK